MNFFSRLFGRSPKDLFLEYTPRGSLWRVVTWNFDLTDSSTRLWTVEVQGEKELGIQWERNKSEEIRFLKNGQILKRNKLKSSESELLGLMNIAIHSTLKFAIESHHEFMRTPVSGATTADFQNEARALQWVQATFGTLTRALDGLKKDSSLILTAACFSGKVPETGENVLRILAFNLDIFFYMRSDSSLQIVVFDDKNLGHGTSKNPSFQQIIKVTKPQFYDEITRLVHHLASVGEIR